MKPLEEKPAPDDARESFQFPMSGMECIIRGILTFLCSIGFALVCHFDPEPNPNTWTIAQMAAFMSALAIGFGVYLRILEHKRLEPIEPDPVQPVASPLE